MNLIFLSNEKMNILLKTGFFSMKYVLPPLKYAINSFFTHFSYRILFWFIFDMSNGMRTFYLPQRLNFWAVFYDITLQLCYIWFKLSPHRNKKNILQKKTFQTFLRKDKKLSQAHKGRPLRLSYHCCGKTEDEDEEEKKAYFISI